MAYATPANMKSRYDSRRLGDLVKDDGTRASESALDTDPVLAELLEDASAIIDSHVLRGDRYLQADLDALAGKDLKLLVRLTCDLAYGLLVQRRGYTASETASLAPAFASAMTYLDRLAGGELIFDVERVRQAGLPQRAVIDKNLQLISSTRRLYGNLIVNPNNPGNPTDFGD